MPNPVVHYEVMGADADALQQFYEEAFSWKFSPTPGAGGATYRFVNESRSGISGGVGSANNGYPGHVTFYVLVDRLEDALEKIAALGGSTMMPPEQVPGGPRIALFKDPEGHVVCLTEATAGM